MRILVTGNAGAGKSTLAAAIGHEFGLPVHGLDRIVWRPGWKKTPEAERRALLQDLIETPGGWVVDGVSGAIMEAAEVIVFLDRPRPVCLWRCLKRNRRYLFRSRPELPERCPELLIVPQLLRIIWRFPRLVRPGILAHMAAHGPKKIVLHVRSEAEAAGVVARLRGAIHDPRSASLRTSGSSSP